MVKTVYAFLLAALLAGLAAIPTQAQYGYGHEHLELVSAESTIDEFGAVFTGTIRNTHPAQRIYSISLFLVLKKDKRVIARLFHRVDETSTHPIDPGAEISFTVETSYKADEYDDFYIRLKGYFDDPSDSWDLIEGCDSPGRGCVEVIEESVYVAEDWVLGEFLNNTNAIFRIGEIHFKLLDARGEWIGDAFSTREIEGTDILAYKTLDFALEITMFPSRRVGDVTGWDVERLKYHAVHLVPITDPIATSATSASWGQIKQGR